ncbi:extracellular solute-binding protein [Beutenbergia cavernae]|uniref:extracellular solute-binding protein n=1 Tax=Beutenbergia cavernae TaxID=84757 RepID=UPI00019AC6E4|nr:extracellular solute-binding protein [Beutenbergia cavernae]
MTEIPADNPIADKLEEITGYEIVVEKSPEDLGAALAGDQAPDLFLTSRSQVRQFDEQGLLLDLTDHRDELSDYESYVGSENVDATLLDGRLVSVVRKPREFSYNGLWIRADWLENLGLAMPTTTAEFHDVLQAFTTGDPDGNGAADTVGITGSGMGTFSAVFGAYGTGGPGTLYADGPAIVDGYNDPAVIEPLTYINTLFAEQLVDPDLFSIEIAEARDRAFQGSAGVVAISWDQMTKPEFVEAQQAAQPGSDWQMISVLDGPDGPGAQPGSPFGVVQAIPASVGDDPDKVEALITLLNYISTPDGSRLVMFGVEGETFEMDGEEVVPLPALDTEGSYFFAYQMTGRDEDTYLATKFPDEAWAWQACMDREQIVLYDALVAPPDGYNVADAARFADEQIVLFVTGERQLTDYDAFLSELNGQFGYAEYVSSAQEQLAALGLPASS